MAIHFFVNFDIFKWLYLAYYWVYLHQTSGFCKAYLHFMIMWINSFADSYLVLQGLKTGNEPAGGTHFRKKSRFDIGTR